MLFWCEDTHAHLLFMNPKSAKFWNPFSNHLHFSFSLSPTSNKTLSSSLAAIKEKTCVVNFNKTMKACTRKKTHDQAAIRRWFYTKFWLFQCCRQKCVCWEEKTCSLNIRIVNSCGQKRWIFPLIHYFYIFVWRLTWGVLISHANKCWILSKSH